MKPLPNPRSQRLSYVYILKSIILKTIFSAQVQPLGIPHMPHKESAVVKAVKELYMAQTAAERGRVSS
jgi:hypothetical protein